MAHRWRQLRVLVCGGRDYADRNAVFKALDELAGDITADTPLGTVEMTVIHGGCPTGADKFADEYAVVNWCQLHEFKADWEKHGKAAGPIRNQRMLDEGKPDIVLAFKGGKGTEDMVRRARRAKVPVKEFE